MASLFRPGAAHDRAALARFDSLFHDWSVASDALAQAEIALWTEALRGGADPCRSPLAAETLKRRETARAAAERVRAALEAADDAR